MTKTVNLSSWCEPATRHRCPTKGIMGFRQMGLLKSAAVSVVSVCEGGASVLQPPQEEEAPEDNQ